MRGFESARPCRPAVARRLESRALNRNLRTAKPRLTAGMVAQTPPALHASVTPSKAGTEAKPRAAKLRLEIAGEIDAAAIVVYFPKRLRITNAGLPRCATSDDRIAAGACDRAKAGSGSATVADNPFALTPLVGAEDLIFKGDSTVLHGTLSHASGRYTAKMRIELPDAWRPLSSLELSLGRIRRAATLFATRGCPLPFKVKAGATVLTAAAKCR